MQITDLHQTKRSNIALYIDGEFLFTLSEEVFVRSHLKIGQEVTVQELEALRLENDFIGAKSRALRLLSGRSYTGRQLGEKLTRHFDAQSVEEAVERMQELGLVNDEDYAMRFSRDLFHLKGFSQRRIRQELRQKGIEDWVIEQALAQFPDEEREERLDQLVERKYLRHLATQKGREKTMAALQRLGYGYEDGRKAIARVMEEQEIEPEDENASEYE